MQFKKQVLRRSKQTASTNASKQELAAMLLQRMVWWLVGAVGDA
jgi:hypothetical protein